MCFLCSLNIDISSPHYKNIFYILSSQKFLEFLEKQFLEKPFSYSYHKVFKNSFINFLKKEISWVLAKNIIHFLVYLCSHFIYPYLVLYNVK